MKPIVRAMGLAVGLALAAMTTDAALADSSTLSANNAMIGAVTANVYADAKKVDVKATAHAEPKKAEVKAEAKVDSVG